MLVDEDNIERYPCPYCLEILPMMGTDGIIVHIMEVHTDTLIAKIILSLLEMRDDW